MVSVKDKASHDEVRYDQGGERKRTTERCRKAKDDVKTGGCWYSGISPGNPVYCLGGVRHKGGATLNQALVWNVGTCRSDDKEEIQVEDPLG